MYLEIIRQNNLMRLVVRVQGVATQRRRQQQQRCGEVLSLFIGIPPVLCNKTG